MQGAQRPLPRPPARLVVLQYQLDLFLNTLSYSHDIKWYHYLRLLPSLMLWILIKYSV